MSHLACFVRTSSSGFSHPSVSANQHASSAIRLSVSAQLMRWSVTDLHDVEYLVPPPSFSGNPLAVLSSTLSSTTPASVEEHTIITALTALRALQSQGLIRAVGIAGYPLPVLLRLSLLALQLTGTPIDIVQSYGHQTVQNSTLSQGYLSALSDRARVRQVVSAAPLSMGLLTPAGGPEWHPARTYPDLMDATARASRLCEQRGTTLVDVALSYGYRPIYQSDGTRVPVVVGCTDLAQLHSTLTKWSAVNSGNENKSSSAGGGHEDAKMKMVEEEVQRLFEDSGVKEWSWACPSDAQRSG